MALQFLIDFYKAYFSFKRKHPDQTFSLSDGEQQFIDESKYVKDSNGFIREKTIRDENWYHNFALVFFFLTFFASWGYCIYVYGYLFGFGLGWIPSLILGGIVATLWPIALFVIVVGLSFIAYILLH